MVFRWKRFVEMLSRHPDMAIEKSLALSEASDA
jgi:hypothetical protein